MKTPLMIPAILLTLAAMPPPSRADNVLFQETFEGPAGAPVNGWNGWAGDPGIVFSRVVIDQGNSITWSGRKEWPIVWKSFGVPPKGDGKTYVLTATLHAPDATGAYADVRLSTGETGQANHVAAQLGYRTLRFEQNHKYDDTMIVLRQSAPTMGVQLVISNDIVVCYYRNLGESVWKLGGKMTAANSFSAYKNVMVAGGVVADRSVGGGVDNLRLAVRPVGAESESAMPSK